jgi:hypothetical protein
MSVEHLPNLILTVDDTGKVTIPGTQPGDILEIAARRTTRQPERLSPEAEARGIQRIRELGAIIRQVESAEWLSLQHGELTKGESKSGRIPDERDTEDQYHGNRR